MELNDILNKKLTKEQKAKLQRDNSKLKLLKNIVIIPIFTTIFGMYLESILVVTISIICIIIFLLGITIIPATLKNVVYDEVIIPTVLKERLPNVETVKKDINVEEKFITSNLPKEYDKFEAKNHFRIIEDRYYINVSKIITKKLSIEESDGVVDKELEENFNGIFAYVKLPHRFDEEFSVVKNEKSIKDLYAMDKADTELMRMNNIEFDKLYDVKSMNPVTVRNILSPGVMERILEINRKMNNVINFSVYGNELYITIEYEKFLEFKSSKDKEYVNEIIAMQNLDTVELLDYFVRYFVNLTEK